MKLAVGSLGKLQPTLKRLDALVTRLDKFNPDPEDRSALVGWLTEATASAGGEGRPALPFEAETLQERIREWLFLWVYLAMSGREILLSQRSLADAT